MFPLYPRNSKTSIDFFSGDKSCDFQEAAMAEFKKNPIMPSFKAMGTILTDIYIIKREK